MSRFFVRHRIIYNFSDLVYCHGGRREDDNGDVVDDVLVSEPQRMKFVWNQRYGWVWRCHKNSCKCNKSSRSALHQTVFYGRNIPVQHQWRIILLWLVYNVPRQAISLLTGFDPETIRLTIRYMLQVMQQDFLLVNQVEPQLDIDQVDLSTVPLTERWRFNHPDKIGKYFITL